MSKLDRDRPLFISSQEKPFSLVGYSVKYEESAKEKVRALVFKEGQHFHTTNWCDSYHRARDSALVAAHRRHFGPNP